MHPLRLHIHPLEEVVEAVVCHNLVIEDVLQHDCSYDGVSDPHQ